MMSDVDLVVAGRLFKEWIAATGMSYSAFARMVPCSPNYPSMWATGSAKPGYRMACRIEELTAGLVPYTVWYPAPNHQIEIPIHLHQGNLGEELNVAATTSL